MGGARRGPNETLSVIESPVVTVATTIELGDIDSVKPHCFAGVQFFSDAEGLIPAVPGAGTVEINIKSINSNAFEVVPGGTITGAIPTTATWAANTLEVKATPSGITTATHYKLVVTCNET